MFESRGRVLTIIAFGIAAAIFCFFFVLREPGLDAGVTSLRIDKPERHWIDEGFVEMTPPVRLPSDRAERDHIKVWLKVGDGRIDARRLDDGRVTISFPTGTVADRVESMGAAVVDVRGTTLVADGGELFHVYVAEDEAPSALVGWEWRRGDFDAEASATRALLSVLDATKRQLRGEPAPSEEQHQASLKSYEKNNNCGACHAHEKPPTIAGDITHRPTDTSGFFVPLSVLADTVPLERHRPWDVNVGDSFLSLECPSGGEPKLLVHGTLRHYGCASSDEVPLARLDVTRAIAARDPRAAAMCASRRYLFEHMTGDARLLFANAFAACKIQ